MLVAIGINPVGYILFRHSLRCIHNRQEKDPVDFVRGSADFVTSMKFQPCDYLFGGELEAISIFIKELQARMVRRTQQFDSRLNLLDHFGFGEGTERGESLSQTQSIHNLRF